MCKWVDRTDSGKPLLEKGSNSIYIIIIGNMINSSLYETQYSLLIMSRGSVVGTATGYGMDDREVEVRVPVESGILTSPYRPDRIWGSPQSRIEWLPGALSPG
jgi:hypothetical protein